MVTSYFFTFPFMNKNDKAKKKITDTFNKRMDNLFKTEPKKFYINSPATLNMIEKLNFSLSLFEETFPDDRTF